MSLDQLRYFVTVAQEGNITRAAERLHVSQPPLSRALRALEDELGTALFTRHRLGVTLLPAGETFLAHVQPVLRSLDRAVAAVQGAPPGGLASLGDP